MTDGLTALEAWTRRDDAPVEEALVAVAIGEDPRCTPEIVDEDLGALARLTRAPPDFSPGRALGHLNRVLYDRLGMVGSVEPDPALCLVHHALGTRRAGPDLLLLLYAAVAARIGVGLDPIGFGAHPVLRPRGSSPIFVDPFHRGRLLDADQLWGIQRTLAPEVPVTEGQWRSMLEPAPMRVAVARLVRTLGEAHAALGDVEGARRARDRLEVLAC